MFNFALISLNNFLLDIKLKIKDYRDFANEPHIKKPYYFYIDNGETKFCFSNKKKAEKFLVNFRKETTFIYKELGVHLSKISTYNLEIIDLIGHHGFCKTNTNLQFTLERYSKVRNNAFISTIYISSEINNLYQIILSNYLFFKNTIYFNNRNNTLLEKINLDIRNLKRVQLSYTLLLANHDRNISTTKKRKIKSYHFSEAE